VLPEVQRPAIVGSYLSLIFTEKSDIKPFPLEKTPFKDPETAKDPKAGFEIVILGSALG
jgi:hypothetical protein